MAGLDVREKEIRAILDRSDTPGLTPEEYRILLRDWDRNSRDYARDLLEMIVDGRSPVSRAERDRLDALLEAAEKGIQELRCKIREG